MFIVDVEPVTTGVSQHFESYSTDAGQLPPEGTLKTCVATPPHSVYSL